MDNPREHEEAIVCQIIMDPGIAAETKLRPKHFATRLARQVFVALQKNITAGVEPDLTTIHDADRTIDAAGLAAISSRVGSTGNWRYYEGAVLEAWRLRSVKKVAQMATEAKGSSEEIIDEMEAGLDAIVCDTADTTIVARRNLITPYLEQVEERYKAGGKIPGLRTGFGRLDKMILGLQPSVFYVIGGRPSKGKSAMLLNMANSIALGRHGVVGFISAESGRNEVMMRTFAASACVDSTQIATGMLTPEHWTALTKAAEDIYNGQFYLYDEPNAPLPSVVSAARRMARINRITVLFVDYIQIIRDRTNADKRDQVAEVSMALKGLARELQIPVVAASQLTRVAGSRRPVLADFSDSSQIEKDADTAILLHEDEEGARWGLVEKNRDGRTGPVRLQFNPSFVRFYEAAGAE